MAVDPKGRYARLMKEVVAFSIEQVQNGGIPFAAFVIDQHGVVLGRGANRVGQQCDLTAHAEIEAIRDACRAHGTTRLPGTTLLASGEPCAMCYMGARYAGISQVLYAIDRDEAAAHDFDYREAYSLFANDPRDWQSLTVEKLTVPQGMMPFRAFRAGK